MVDARELSNQEKQEVIAKLLFEIGNSVSLLGVGLALAGGKEDRVELLYKCVSRMREAVREAAEKNERDCAEFAQREK